MRHIYKYLGSDEQVKKLWQNKESLELYLTRLKDFWDDDNQCWLEIPKTKEPPNMDGSVAKMDKTTPC